MPIFKIAKILLTGILLVSTGFAQNNSPLKSRLDNYFKNKYFNSSFVICKIYDLGTNSEVYNRYPEKLARPASVLKIVTSAAAVKYLGSDYAFVTNLFYSGEILDGVLNGDVFVRGSGDPDFSSRDLEYFALKLKSLGIREINGNLFGDVSLFDSLKWGNGWMWDDDPDADFSYFSPLIVDNAAVNVIVRPGIVGQPAEVELFPISGFYSFTNSTITTNLDTSDVEVTRNWLEDGNDLSAAGEISFREKVDTTKINLAHPEQFFLYRFSEILEKNNITVAGILDTTVTPYSAVQIGSVARPLSTIIRNMNKQSDNLSAEMVLRAMAVKYFGTPASAENGVKVVNSFLKELSLEPGDYKIVDGSGVSHYNLISADALMESLKSIFTDTELRKVVYPSLPVSGVSGTLRDRLNTPQVIGKVRAKTGTLSGVSNLAGFVRTNSGKNLAFVLMMQNFSGKHKTFRWFQDKFCEILIKEYK